MPESRVLLHYEGPIDFQRSEILLKQVKNKLAELSLKEILKKRLYAVMVECIENLMRYAANKVKNNFQPTVSLEEADTMYRVFTSNLISNSNLGLLEDKLKKIVRSNREQLQEMYEEQINKETNTSRIGAGLGFMIMSLKSDRPIEYSFKKISDEFSIFELSVMIPIDIIN